MDRIASFQIVSQEQFQLAMDKNDLVFSEDIYHEILLPKRATEGSAGYDFYAPFTFTLAPGESLFIPTGIRAEIARGWVLMLFPRSGLGIKYQLQLDNTVGVIDSDYYFAENEGHIMTKITNHSSRSLTIEKGQGFVQGVFLPFGITVDDNAQEKRIGGFGSTTKK